MLAGCALFGSGYISGCVNGSRAWHEWLTLKANLRTLDESSPAVMSSSESLVSATEQQRQESERQSSLAAQYKRDLNLLLPELVSLRTLLPEVRSELAESIALQALTQTKYDSAQSSLEQVEQSLTDIRNETTAALWTGIAIGVGAGADGGRRGLPGSSSRLILVNYLRGRSKPR